MAGWCAAGRGEQGHGIALTRDAIALLEATQSLHFTSYLIGLLVDMHAKAGDHSEAMTTVQKGLARADATGERFYIAELHRLRGELLAHPSIGDIHEAQAEFRTASRIAKQQGAFRLERKAAESLRRLI